MLRSVCIALGLGMAAPAAAFQAEAPTPQVEPTADAIEAARHLLRSADFNAQFAATARQTAEACFDAVTRQLQQQYGTEFPDAMMARFRAIMREHTEQVIADMLPTALEDSARVYARYFTAAEIRELESLQSRPVLVKMQRIAPS